MNDQRFPDMLDWRSVQGRTYFAQPLRALLGSGASRPDLDQPMAQEVLVDFIEDGRGEAGVADQHRGAQVMAARAQFTSLCRCQFKLHCAVPMKDQIVLGVESSR